MRRHPSPHFSLRALRRDRLPFAVLGAFMLSLQLFLAGFVGAAMAAAPNGDPLGVLCIGDRDERTDHAPVKDAHPGECPCLAGTCAQVGAPQAPGELSGGHDAVFPAASPIPPTASLRDRIDRRPLSLFARAGRGPPPLS